MRLTPKQAQRQIEQEPVVNRQHEAEVSRAMGEATQTGQEYLTAQAKELSTQLTAVQESAAVEVRDGLEKLVREGMTQAVSFEQYSSRYDQLTDRLVVLEQERDELARRLEYLEQIEADPADFTNNLYQRFPALRRPDFRFE